MYFTITVFSTVGFGDITPRTDSWRILVSIQMLLDLVIIGAVVRILINAAKMGLARNDRQLLGTNRRTGRPRPLPLTLAGWCLGAGRRCQYGALAARADILAPGETTKPWSVSIQEGFDVQW